MGKRIDLSQLATQAVLDAPVPQLLEVSTRLTRVPLTAVASNPVNPREVVGDLSDLESMRTVGQLQPCVVVTRAAFLTVYEEHAEAVGSCDYVIVAGSRRRQAAERFGLDILDVVVRDVLAADRATFYAASVSENIDRRNLDALEEARAVEHLVQECGSGTKAGEILGKTKGWVSQRLSLLKLSPQMQALLRAGDLPIRDARRLAQLPEAEQLAAWEAERAIAQTGPSAGDDGLAAGGQPQKAEAGAAVPGRASGRQTGTRIPAGATAAQIVDILGQRLTDDDLSHLIAALWQLAKTRGVGLPR